MEEDIERIENLIKKCDECKLKECINCEISWIDVQAIGNLLKAYKKLEERNIYLVNERKKLEELLFMSDENYIEKSLIKEKIEELNKAIEEVEQNIKNTTDEEKRYWKKEKHDLIMQRYILQELLESERGIRIN